MVGFLGEKKKQYTEEVQFFRGEKTTICLPEKKIPRPRAAEEG